MKGYIKDKEFGTIIVELRRGMTRVRFGFLPDGKLLVRAFPMSARELAMIIDRNRALIRGMKRPEAIELRVGQEIECYRCKVVIGTQRTHPGHVLSRITADGVACHVLVHEQADVSQLQRTLSTAIGHMMAKQAERLLLPFAAQVAAELGLKPARFVVGRGMRELGHCTRAGVIQLSRNLMFMPEPLIRYVVCHELAHLTHMDHSPEFHALCSQYCGGQEKELERQLRQFRFPILK